MTIQISNPYEDDFMGLSQVADELSPGWQQFANCLGVDPNLFYPERGVSTSEAKAVCQRCQVKEECLEYAVQNGEKFGIWGGMSERERRRIRKARRLQHAQDEEEQTVRQSQFGIR